MQKFRQIPRKISVGTIKQQAVVGEADAEAHQKKSGEKQTTFSDRTFGSR